MQKTGIDYLTHTWNPIAMKCTPVSEGCANCWHLAMCKRHAGNPALPLDVRAAKEGGPPVLLAGELEAPLRLREPARIGVQFMGDLFHEDVKPKYRNDVLRVARTIDGQRHTFLFLTKRPENVNSFPACRHMWLGVSVENQERADERISKLRAIIAAVKFVSFEPLLGNIDAGLRIEPPPCSDLPATPWPVIDWLIIGCESGAGRRPCKLEWVESLVGQADDAGVPPHVKQLEIDGKVTSDMLLWPEWARRREFPKTAGSIAPGGLAG